jgi:secretion/DNA translocation related TadE-like protein
LGDERGSASILGCFIMAALIVITATVLHVGSVVVVRHRLQAAADLAALAVASSLDRGATDACVIAQTVAVRMGVGVRSCRIHGWDAVVETHAPVSPLFGDREASAIARAGPAAPEPEAPADESDATTQRVRGRGPHE